MTSHLFDEVPFQTQKQRPHISPCQALYLKNVCHFGSKETATLVLVVCFGLGEEASRNTLQEQRPKVQDEDAAPPAPRQKMPTNMTNGNLIKLM